MSDNSNNEFVQHDTDGTLDDTSKGMELEALASGAAGALTGSPLGAMGAITGALLGSSIDTVASGEPMHAIDFEGDWDKFSAHSNDPTSADGSSETSSASDAAPLPDSYANTTATALGSAPMEHPDEG